MCVTVREIAPVEHAAVAELTASVYIGEGLTSLDYEPQLRDVTGRAEQSTVLVALLREQLVGSLAVATRGGPLAELAVPGEAVIRMLAVAPEARGVRVGEALVRAALELARQDGCAMVRLSSQTNMTAAHRLYARLGFVRTPSLDWFLVPGLLLEAFALPLAPWCGHCGRELTVEGHEACRRSAELDPPRYCLHCRRRMVVQVTPTGWSADCSEHGRRTS